jgi:hypothetical protein
VPRHKRKNLRERREIRPTPTYAWGFDNQQYGNSVDQQVDSGVDGTVQPVVWGYTTSGDYTFTHWSDGTTTRTRWLGDFWPGYEAELDRQNNSRREQLGVE